MYTRKIYGKTYQGHNLRGTYLLHFCYNYTKYTQ